MLCSLVYVFETWVSIGFRVAARNDKVYDIGSPITTFGDDNVYDTGSPGSMLPKDYHGLDKSKPTVTGQASPRMTNNVEQARRLHYPTLVLPCFRGGDVVA